MFTQALRSRWERAWGERVIARCVRLYPRSDRILPHSSRIHAKVSCEESYVEAWLGVPLLHGT